MPPTEQKKPVQDSAGASARSEDLLRAAPGEADDAGFEVAEEVSLDQQSDQARRVGQAPAAPAGSEAMATTLQPDPAVDGADGQAPERAVPHDGAAPPAAP